MQTANIMLSLNAGNDVPKRGVSAAEIAVLIAIHGDDAVKEVEPTGASDTIDIDGNTVKWTNRVELDRLRRRYGRAKDGEDKAIVDNLFPGAAARVFETLDELNLPESFYKATARHKPEAAAPSNPLDHDRDGVSGGAVPSTEEGLKGMTVAQLKELAAKSNIDLGDAKLKADIIGVIEEAVALAAEPDEDGAEPEVTPPPTEPEPETAGESLFK
jgi:hypothetical protein